MASTTIEAVSDSGTILEGEGGGGDNSNNNNNSFSNNDQENQKPPGPVVAAAIAAGSKRPADDATAAASTSSADRADDGSMAPPAKIMATTSSASASASSSSSSSTILRINPEKVRPISSLVENLRDWVIRARVSSKTPMHTFKNSRGPGKLFSFECFDGSGRDLRVTAFNADADHFYPVVELHKVYLISKGAVKVPTDKRFARNADFEVTLYGASQIELVTELAVTDNIPNLSFKFVPLAEVMDTPSRTLIDVIAVVRSVGQLETLNVPPGMCSSVLFEEDEKLGQQTKSSPRLLKRELTIVDQSGAEARLTLWNDLANSFTGAAADIVALKNVIVGDFKGKTLSTCDSSVLEVEPAANCLEEAAFLRGWWTLTGAKMAKAVSFETGGFKKLSTHTDVNSLVNSSFRFLCQLSLKLFEAADRDPSIASASGLIFSSVNCVIVATNGANKTGGDDILYQACENEGCTKKVIPSSRGSDQPVLEYYCMKCEKTSTRFKWVLKLTVEVRDATGSRWVRLFQANAEKLLGVTVEELAAAKEATEKAPNDETAASRYYSLLNGARLSDYYLRLGSRMMESSVAADEEEEEGGSVRGPSTNSFKKFRLSTDVYSLVQQSPEERSRRLLAMIPRMAAQLF